jgi:hypothetical protein
MSQTRLTISPVPPTTGVAPQRAAARCPATSLWTAASIPSSPHLPRLRAAARTREARWLNQRAPHHLLRFSPSTSAIAELKQSPPLLARRIVLSMLGLVPPELEHLAT